MRHAYFLAGLILGVTVAVFALQNSSTVEVRFLFWQAQGSLALAVLSAFGAGLLAALLLGIPEALLVRRRTRSLERSRKDRPPEGVGEPHLRDAA